MGRGRAKAKQTKVARNLKYQTHDTDFGALARELRGESGEQVEEQEDTGADPDGDADPWSDYAERD
ncbi:DUF3073 domain-containing protein [Nocardioidaceae bacterium]|nr:DUF3073 domain-containing protein [Nocardioidaceae bacterium]